MTAHVAKNTGNMEWITPGWVVEIARGVMNGIDLDPLSSEVAQSIVRAKGYFTKEHNGFDHEWFGRVWLNPPYATETLRQTVRTLIADMKAGYVTQAVMLTNNATETKWAHDLMSSNLVSVVAFAKGRIKFLRVDEDGQLRPKLNPLQGQMLWGLNVNKIIFRSIVKNSGFGKSFLYID